jgi:hypothetical protein
MVVAGRLEGEGEIAGEGGETGSGARDAGEAGGAMGEIQADSASPTIKSSAPAAHPEKRKLLSGMN